MVKVQRKTTIQISEGTLERLKEVRKFARQSYDDLLNEILDEYEEPLTTEEISDIQKALDDVKKGRVHSIESVAKEIGVSLK